MISVLGKNATLEQVREVPLVQPDGAGKWWRGIQHGVLVDTLTAQIESKGWKITDQQFALQKNGARLVGAFDLRLPNVKSPGGMTLGLGLLTDNICEQSLRLYAGATMTICSNGMVSGEHILRHKHTINFDLRQEVDWALDDYMISARKLRKIVARMRKTELKEPRFEHTLIEAGRRGLMPWSRLSDVDHEYHKSSFGEEEFQPGTEWALMGAFTHVCKRNPIQSQMDQINRFRELLTTAV